MPDGISITELSKEIGISKQTLYNWMKEYKYGNNDTQSESRSPRQWKSEEKYSAVLEAAGLSDDDLGKWLREKGLHSDHLDLWEKEMKQMLSSTKQKEELKVAKKRIKELEKELSRKEKALAEVSALLVLKKKRILYGGSG